MEGQARGGGDGIEPTSTPYATRTTIDPSSPSPPAPAAASSSRPASAAASPSRRASGASPASSSSSRLGAAVAAVVEPFRRAAAALSGDGGGGTGKSTAASAFFGSGASNQGRARGDNNPIARAALEAMRMRRKSLTAEEAEAIIAASGLGAAAGGAGVEAGGAGGASFGGGGGAAAPSLAAPRIRSRRGSSGDVPLPPPAAGDDSLPPVGGALFSAAAAAAAASAGGAEPGARVVPLGPPALAAAALPPPPPAAVRRGLFRSKKRPLPSPPHHHPHFQQHFSSNAIKTAKYNALTFLPRFLFEMFSRAAYLYFLLQAVLSWIPVVSPFGGWGSTLALLFVLLVAAVKALFEDVKRHQQDRATNASRARVVVAKPPSSGSSPSSSTLETRDVEWRDLRVGDVVRVDDGELFPADLVCLHSALEDDVCFIKTTNLDGENNLKIRRPVDVSDAFPPSSSSSSSSTATNADGDDGDDDASLARPSAWDVLSLRGALTAEAPNANLHVFKGRLALEVPAVAVAEEDGERGKGDGGESAAAATTRAPTASAPAATATGTAATTMMTTTTTTIKTTTKTVPVTINEVLLRGCLLKNTGHVLGLVVYTGRESRIQMNSAATPSKVGSYDHFLNFQIALVMALQLALCVFSAAAGAAWRELAGRRRAHLGMESPSEGNVRSPVLYAGVLFVTFWILYSYLVPISLFVTLEIVKFWQGFVYVNWDEGMRDPATGDYALARNTSLIEDLGKVDYVFSDKTGTLTSNEMQLRQIAVKDTVYGSAEFRLEEWLQQRQQREGGGGGEDGGAAGCGDWRACARAWDPRAAAAAEALTLDGSWRSLVAAGGSGRRELALRSSKSEASLALASAASAAASAASEETRGKSRGGGNDEEDGEEVTSSAPPRAPRAPTNGDGADEERDPALLGAHLVDFWTNVCVCHSLIVEPASSSASTPSSPASAATATAAAAATATAAASAASAAAAAAAPSPPLPPSRPVYQGPSPDEVALVEAARAVGYEFVGRSAGGVVLSLLGARVVFEVLAVLEYSSARARMSVVARAPDGTVRLFCKGADARVLGMLRSSTSPVLLAATNRNLRAFAQRGLRTLALATKVIDPSVWADWHARYRAAGSLLDGRDEALALLAEEVERDLELVGVTAIEDKLQEGVPEAIAALLGAGVKVWVITGDKRETATNIAVSCNLVRRPEALLVLDAASREGATAELARAAAELEARGLGPVVAAGDACPASVPVAASSSTAAACSPSSSNKDNANFGVPAELVIDGATLSHILGDPVLESNLAAVGALCSSVVVCRSSPSQKAGIVRMMREHEAATAGAGKRWRVTRWYARQMRKQSGRMLSVGDGANDVAMIQAADVGVGIIGKEGRQAVNNADFAISQFRFLVRLLLVHGSLSAYRLSRLIKYSFYKNVAFGAALFLYQFYCGFSGQALVDDISAAAYNVVFTSLPIMAFAVLDRPVDRVSALLDSPATYHPRSSLTTRSFWKNGVLMACVDACVCFFVPLYGLGSLGGGGRHSRGARADASAVDVYSLGKAVFVALLGCVTLEVALVSRFWTPLFVFVLLGSYALVFPFQIGYAALLQAKGTADAAQNGAALAIFSSPRFWLVCLLCAFGTFGHRLAERGFVWLFKPQDNMILQEMERDSEKEEEEREKEKKEERKRKEVGASVA